MPSSPFLQSITKIAGWVVTFDPKPIPGDWNGASAQTDYRYDEDASTV